MSVCNTNPYTLSSGCLFLIWYVFIYKITNLESTKKKYMERKLNMDGFP